MQEATREGGRDTTIDLAHKRDVERFSRHAPIADLAEWELRPSVTEEDREFELLICSNGELIVHTATCGVQGNKIIGKFPVPAWWVETRFPVDVALHDTDGRVGFCGNCTVRRIK